MAIRLRLAESMRSASRPRGLVLLSVLTLAAVVTGIAATVPSQPKVYSRYVPQAHSKPHDSKRSWSQESKALAKALHDPGQRIPSLYRLVRGSIDAGDWCAARRYTSELLMSDSQNISLLKTLALCELRAGYPIAAIATAQKAQALASDDSEIPLLIAEAVDAALRAVESDRPIGGRVHP